MTSVACFTRCKARNHFSLTLSHSVLYSFFENYLQAGVAFHFVVLVAFALPSRSAADVEEDATSATSAALAFLPACVVDAVTDARGGQQGVREEGG
jgi:hypothetical protein